MMRYRHLALWSRSAVSRIGAIAGVRCELVASSRHFILRRLYESLCPISDRRDGDTELRRVAVDHGSHEGIIPAAHRVTLQFVDGFPGFACNVVGIGGILIAKFRRVSLGDFAGEVDDNGRFEVAPENWTGS
jgi:hypothetical protein